MKRFHKIFIVLFILSSITVLFFSLELLKTLSNENNSYLLINNKKYQVELALTPPQWQKGLSGREFLCERCGMLFIFPDSGIKEFWMKDMLIPLDIVWIDNNVVVGVEKAVPAPNNGQLPAIVRSPGAVDMVLEVNANQFDDLKMGDRVHLNR